MKSSQRMMVREFCASDYQRCSEIFQRAWNLAFPTAVQPVRAEQLMKETTDERMLVAEKDSTVVGFASIFEPESFLHHLYVDPDHHRQGIGTLLLAYAEQTAKAELSLKCQIANSEAIRFYKRQGYSESGESGESTIGPWVRLTKA